MINNDLPRCPICDDILEEVWANVGFTAHDPEHWQVESYKCSRHGEVEPNTMTQQKFEAYLAVQKSGITNMFDVKMVIQLSDGELTKEDCLDIMKNYAKYEIEYGVSVNDVIGED